MNFVDSFFVSSGGYIQSSVVCMYGDVLVDRPSGEILKFDFALWLAKRQPIRERSDDNFENPWQMGTAENIFSMTLCSVNTMERISMKLDHHVSFSSKISLVQSKPWFLFQALLEQFCGEWDGKDGAAYVKKCFEKNDVSITKVGYQLLVSRYNLYFFSLPRKPQFGIDLELWDLEKWKKIGILNLTGGRYMTPSTFLNFATKNCKKKQIILQLVMPNWLRKIPVYSQKTKKK